MSVYPRIFGVADASGDGHPDVFIKLSAILYHVGGQQILGLFTVADGKLVHVRIEGAGRTIFPVGGISGYGDGAFCPERGPPRFVLRHIRRVGVPAKRYRWKERVFVWRGTTLVRADLRHGTEPIELLLYDPRILPYYQLRCGDLRPP
jgi:hypothetical protein